MKKKNLKKYALGSDIANAQLEKKTSGNFWNNLFNTGKSLIDSKVNQQNEVVEPPVVEEKNNTPMIIGIVVAVIVVGVVIYFAVKKAA